MYRRLFLLLLLSYLMHTSKSQSTLELFSLEGLTLAYTIHSDIVGDVHRQSCFYIKDTIIDSKSYLEYQNKACHSTFYRVDGYKVYLRNVYDQTDEPVSYTHLTLPTTPYV